MMFPSDEPLDTRFALRREEFRHDGFRASIVVPECSDSLIDEAEFETDERLPYWAELWPAARALARWLLDRDGLPERAIELGCGVALPSLALVHRGVSVLATDYYDEALRFARHNARSNGLGELPTRLIDWRAPPPDLSRFPLVVAADVLYEGRNADALQRLLPGLVEPAGSAVIADPGRVYLPGFLERMEATDWNVALLAESFEPAPTGNDRRVTVRIYELDRSAAAEVVDEVHQG